MKFSAIIPAYNEAPRIAQVIQTALESQFLDEIIVIDDGSTDETASILHSMNHIKLQKIFLKKNGGKAKAVIEWIRQSHWDYIVMIDSDLIGLKPRHINAMILPINEQIADTTLSLRRDSMLICRLFGSDFLSGDRVLPREIFVNEDFFVQWKWYGLEVKLNAKILEKNYRIKNIYFSDVSAPDKRSKYGFWNGIKKDLKMFSEVLKSVSIIEFIRQFFLFSRFSSRTK